MKWAVVVLIILGLLAAFSAALLVRTLRHERIDELKGRGEVNAVVATKPLPAMSWITSQNVAVKKVKRKGLAADYFSDTAQVVGKVLAIPVVQDQVITRRSLITEGSGAQLAAALPHGMRAMSVPVSRHSVMGGLLYPGCLVDVIATFRLSSSQDKGQAISTTLLHNIQVLAVQEESIISKNEPGKTPSKGRSDSGGTLTVTLMVDGRQAEALQLAMDNGKVTLAMKNPLDLKTADAEAMVLSQGRLAKLGELMSSSVYASPVGGNPDSNGLEDPNGSYVRQDATDDQSAERLRRMFGGEQSGQKPQWEITVIRGKDVKEEIVDITAETPEQE